MAYKLSVANKVVVPIKLAVDSDGKEHTYSFDLNCKRLTAEEISARLERKEMRIADFLREVVTGWRGQTLVVDDADNPAEFSDAAFDVMLSLPGAAMLFYTRYVKEAGAKEKN